MTEAIERGRESATAPASKAEDLAHALRAEIATGGLAAGTMLDSEAELMQRFGVSRPTYREAIRMLESEGLVEVRRGVGGGTRVLEPTLEPLSRNLAVILQARDIKLESLFDARLLYEPEIAAELARRRDGATLSKLAEIAAAQEFATGNRARYNELERDFRRTLIRGSGNPIIRLMGVVIDDVFNRHIANMSLQLPTLSFESAHLSQGAHAKQVLVRALAEGDHVNARRIWRAYIAKYARRVSAVVGGQDTILAYKKP